jgi:hypothetical protein
MKRCPYPTPLRPVDWFNHANSNSRCREVNEYNNSRCKTGYCWAIAYVRVLPPDQSPLPADHGRPVNSAQALR